MDKILVQKANVVLDVNAEDKDYYMSLGYSVIDENGKVVEAAMPNDVGALQIMVKQLQKENAELKQQLSKPKQQNAKQKEAK